MEQVSGVILFDQYGHVCCRKLILTFIPPHTVLEKKRLRQRMKKKKMRRKEEKKANLKKRRTLSRKRVRKTALKRVRKGGKKPKNRRRRRRLKRKMENQPIQKLKSECFKIPAIAL